MANITVRDISEYNITGSDKFDNSISFIRDLSDDELNSNRGGGFWDWIGLGGRPGSGSSRN
jgi:hypothetical protein